MFAEGKDGDLVCFTCGFVSYALEPLDAVTAAKRERRPSTGGMLL